MSISPTVRARIETIARCMDTPAIDIMRDLRIDPRDRPQVIAIVQHVRAQRK